MHLQRRNILPIVSFATLVVLMALLSVHTLTYIFQDIGRHITIGRIIWQTHQIPKTNLFSYTAPDFPFINHHWFAEVLIYLGDRAVGLKGLILINAILLALGYGLALAAAWRPRLALPAIGVGLLSALIIMERTDVRPETLSILFLGWYLFVLFKEQDKSPDSKYLLWTLPVVQLLWVNSHIYFFMGPFLWLAFLAGKFAKGEWRLDIRDWRALISNIYFQITLLIAVATLCNPWGLAGALYPFRIFSNYGYTILENQSPFFLAGMHYPPLTTVATYLGIAVTALSFIINWRRLRSNVFGAIVFVSTAVLALTMIRNFPLLAMAMMPIVLTNLDQASWHSSDRHWLVIGLIILGLFGATVVNGQLYQQARISWREFGLTVPAGYQGSVDFFNKAGLKGPVFNNFDIGSFLIWKLPQEPVFVDGRPEAYPADFMENVYKAMQEDPDAWDHYSDEYKINTVVWGYQDMTWWSHAFVRRITSDHRWVVVYIDGAIVILVKDVPVNAEIIRKHRLDVRLTD